jgi:CTP synthase
VVGDYENVLFLEAARQMKVEGNKVLFIHVTYLPVLMPVGEMKTKPTQHSVMAVRVIGIQPDFIVCRSETVIDEPIKEKIALFCNVCKEDIISDPDVDNIYKVPLEFEKQEFGNKILSKLGLIPTSSNLNDWRQFVENMNANRRVPIGLVGKYFDIGKFRLPDAYISVIEAIKHASAANRVRVDLRWIVSTEFEKRSRILRF